MQNDYEDYFVTHSNKLTSKSLSLTLPKDQKLFIKSPSQYWGTPRSNSHKLKPTVSYFKSLPLFRSHSYIDTKQRYKRVSLYNKNAKKSLIWIISRTLRSFEQEQSLDLRIEVCKSIRKWVKLAPKSFPRELCAALVALSDSDSDDLQEFAQELLRLLSIKNCEVLVACGGLQILLKKALDPRISPALCENIILTLTYLLNEPQTRQYFNNGRELLRIFAVFTDYETGLKDSEEFILLKSARKVLVLMMRSWTGLIYLTNNGLDSLVKTLTHPIKPLIKEEILDMLFEILNIQTNTACFSYSLINNYLAILIKALLNCGIIQVLENLAARASQSVNFRAKKLLQLICKTASDLLPGPPIIIYDFKGEKLKLINEITVNNREKRQRHFGFLSQAIKFVNHSIEINNFKSKKSIFQKFLINNANDFTIIELISNTKAHKKLRKWKWDLILQALLFYLTSDQYFSLPESQLFLKTILAYFSPSKNFFQSLPWHKDHLVKAKAGRLLLKLLLSKPESSVFLTSTFSDSLFQPRKSFLIELKECIKEEIIFKHSLIDSSARVLTCDNVHSCMAREYFLWVEVFLSSKVGRKLFKSYEIYENLQQLYCIDHLTVLILPLLDYRKVVWQSFMELVLQSSLLLKFKALEQLRCIYRSKNSDLSWIIGSLKCLLSSSDKLLVNTTLHLLDELCANVNNLTALVQTGPHELFFLGDLGKNVVFHLLKLPEGVEYLKNCKFLQRELESWNSALNIQFARIIEEKIEQKMDPPKLTYSLYMQPPKDYDPVTRIDWITRLPILICIVTSAGRKYELQPLIFFSSEYLELFILLDITFTLSEGIGAGLVLGMTSIDIYGKECQEESLTWCTKDLLDDFLCFEKSGIKFQFIDSLKPKLFSVTFKVKIDSKSLPVFCMPKHFFAELSKTSEGLGVLKGSGHLTDYCEILIKQGSVLNKRAVLWALGCVGSTDLGAEELDRIGAVKLMVHIAEKCPILSLRGTAFQALGLISRNLVGKRVLLALGWVCNEVNNAAIILPSNLDSFFFIEKTQEFLPFHQKVEDLESSLNKNKLSKIESEVFELVCSLGSVLEKGKIEKTLKILKKGNPGIFLSQNLFNSVMGVISVYQFSLTTRQFIHKLFDLIPQGPLLDFDMYRYIL